MGERERKDKMWEKERQDMERKSDMEERVTRCGRKSDKKE